jgi:hypothetical protein
MRDSIIRSKGSWTSPEVIVEKIRYRFYWWIAIGAHVEIAADLSMANFA